MEVLPSLHSMDEVISERERGRGGGRGGEGKRCRGRDAARDMEGERRWIQEEFTYTSFLFSFSFFLFLSVSFLLFCLVIETHTCLARAQPVLRDLRIGRCGGDARGIPVLASDWGSSSRRTLHYSCFVYSKFE